MSRGLFNALWRDERLRFLAVGGFNTLFGFTVYAVVYYSLGEDIHYLVLAVAAHFISVTLAFTLYRHHVFKSRAPVFREFIRYNLTVLGNFGFSLVALAALVSYINIHPVIAQAIVMLMLVMD